MKEPTVEEKLSRLIKTLFDEISSILKKLKDILVSAWNESKRTILGYSEKIYSEKHYQRFNNRKMTKGRSTFRYGVKILQ